MITNQRDFVLPTSRHIFAVGGDHNHQAEAALIGSKQPVFINLLMGPTVNRRPGAETRKALFVVLKPVAQVCSATSKWPDITKYKATQDRYRKLATKP